MFASSFLVSHMIPSQNALQHIDNPLIRGAFVLQRRVETFRCHARELLYAVMLFRRKCPQCGAMHLNMLRDSWCRCRSCGTEFDPTLAFESCRDCGSPLEKKIYHYWCPVCRSAVTSPYCFDARVFDASYFRDMMRDSRQRKEQQREAVRQLLAESRSPDSCVDLPLDFDQLPGLSEELDAFVGCPLPKELLEHFAGRADFDLNRYQRHIMSVVSGCILHFEGIMPLLSDPRLDRIFRFIALIFLAHDGQVALTQSEGGEILVTENETH